MPRYDPDVIAALAEGLLDPDEAAAVEREIMADPVAAADLAAQRIALAAVSAAGRPELTMSERSDLHSMVADALGVSAPDPVAPRSRRVPWGSLGIAAVALAGLLAVVPIVGLLSTGGGDSTASLDLAAEAAPTSAAAETEARSAVDDEAAPAAVVGVADEDDALTSGLDATTDAATFGSSTTVAHTTTTPPAPTTSTSAATQSGDSTTSSQASTVPSDGLDQLTQELTAIREDPNDLSSRAVAAKEEDQCWVEDSGVRGTPIPERFSFEYDNGQRIVIVYYEVTEGAAGPFQVWDVPDCIDLLVIP